MRLGDLDALKKTLSDKDLITWTHEYGDAIPVDWLMSAIDNAPTIKTFTLADIEEQYRKGLEKGLTEWETQRPQGEWIQYRKGHYTGVKCSLCDTIMDFTSNYCPKCGAYMRGINNG